MYCKRQPEEGGKKGKKKKSFGLFRSHLKTADFWNLDPNPTLVDR